MRRHLLPILALVGLPFVGCTKTDTPAPPAVAPSTSPKADGKAGPFPITLTDLRGKSLTLASAPKRIVSLTPSNTEILFALGLDRAIVGVTTACDYPLEAKQKPKIGAYPFSTEAILSQNPDLVIGDAVLTKTPLEALDRSQTPTLAVGPKTIADVYASIKLIGRATGKEAEAEKLVSDLQARIETIRQKAATAKTIPIVFMVYSLKPIYTTGPGSFIDEIIGIAGGKNMIQEPAPGDEVSPEKVVELSPNVIICSPDLQGQIKRMPGWDILPAVEMNQFYSSANDSPLVRPGPRLAQAAENLARYLHPDLFPSAPAPKTP